MFLKTKAPPLLGIGDLSRSLLCCSDPLVLLLAHCKAKVPTLSIINSFSCGNLIFRP